MQYHSRGFVDWLRSQGCAVCGHTPSECAHVRSRGAGGTWEDIAPLCRQHHAEQHQMGVASFAALHGIDLNAAAEDTRRRWDAR